MSSIANIFRRQKPKNPNASFDRATRDILRRRPNRIVRSEERMMLLGDTRGAYLLVNPFTMQTRFSRKRITLRDGHIGS